VNNELERNERKRSWPNLEYCSDIWQEGPRKIMKTSVSTTGLRAWFGTRDLLNTKKEYYLIWLHVSCWWFIRRHCQYLDDTASNCRIGDVRSEIPAERLPNLKRRRCTNLRLCEFMRWRERCQHSVTALQVM
jgi:hypothetical protein